MTSIMVVDKGNYGFDVTPIDGLGLSVAEADDLQVRIDSARALSDAILVAMRDARAEGVTEFNPADQRYLTLPAGLSDTDREYLFSSVVGRAYAGGPLNMAEWSQAVDALDQWAALSASMLPSEVGGGVQNNSGIWFANGQSWSAAEIFTINRVNTLADIDRLVTESLNVIEANNEEAKALTELMQRMFKKYYENSWDNENVAGFRHVSRSWLDAVGTLDQESAQVFGRNVWGEGSEYISASEGATPLQRPMPYDRLLALALKYIGPNSLIAGMASQPDTAPDPGNGNTIGYEQVDFRATIDEVESLIGAFAEDNQVAQLRNETLLSTRANLLEGLSTFVKGQQTTRSTLARNT